MFDINLEAMQALLKSRLGTALDALWQEVIDYRDSTLTDVTYRNKIIALRKYFEKNTVPKFKEIVWKYVGLHIETVHMLDIFSTGSFCTMMFIDKEQGKYGGAIQIESVLNAESENFLNGHAFIFVAQGFVAVSRTVTVLAYRSYGIHEYQLRGYKTASVAVRARALLCRSLFCSLSCHGYTSHPLKYPHRVYRSFDQYIPYGGICQP